MDFYTDPRSKEPSSVKVASFPSLSFIRAGTILAASPETSDLWDCSKQEFSSKRGHIVRMPLRELIVGCAIPGYEMSAIFKRQNLSISNTGVNQSLLTDGCYLDEAANKSPKTTGIPAKPDSSSVNLLQSKVKQPAEAVAYNKSTNDHDHMTLAGQSDMVTITILTQTVKSRELFNGMRMRYFVGSADRNIEEAVHDLWDRQRNHSGSDMDPNPKANVHASAKSKSTSSMHKPVSGGYCYTCNSNCNTCDGTGSDDCTSCSDGGYCYTCNSNCNTCDGTGSDDCTSCSDVSSNPSENDMFDASGRAIIEVEWIEMKTSTFRQNEDMTGLLEGNAEVYMWSSTFDYLTNNLVTRSVGVPCVQAVDHRYQYNFKIGAVSVGQSIRIGVWEWDDVTGWTDDSLGDKWVFPDDFIMSDTVEYNMFPGAKWKLRCAGCRYLTGTAPDPFISENPEFEATIHEMLSEDSSTQSSTLLPLWNYDTSTQRAAEDIDLFDYTDGDRFDYTDGDSSSGSVSAQFTLDIDCENCYAGVEDGELVVDYELNPITGYEYVASEVTADFKLNIDFLVTLTGEVEGKTSSNVITRLCAIPACLGFSILGVELQIGFLFTLDFVTTMNAVAEIQASPGFDLIWHIKYGFVYDYDTGPITTCADSSLTFNAHPLNLTASLDATIDMALKPTIQIGFFGDIVFIQAHALAGISTEAYLQLQGHMQWPPSTDMQLFDDNTLDDFLLPFGISGLGNRR
ncbi:hypothetical protein CYMTET_29475 [Cymbomonas tetramitiformis]|uniref:Uncharacterized protein n=1 Tax=Cymbomonas tetramitiformis TaxID=36881 RepID=A0AAE0KV45_9CHLO|nr:hypothetical protein CYMTET_29475 [Cymbomonas tetramitiformis]